MHYSSSSATRCAHGKKEVHLPHFCPGVCLPRGRAVCWHLLFFYFVLNTKGATPVTPGRDSATPGSR